jgi:hypothetical protein
MEFPSGNNQLLLDIGGIVFVKKYQYEDGGEPTDKLLIVLSKDINNKVIYLTFTLTTSKLEKYGIDSSKINHGCSNPSEYPYHHFHHYKKGTVVGQNGYSFEDDTIILVQNNIRYREASHFDKYSSANYELNFKDKLKDEELKLLLECLKDSIHIPSDLKKILNNSLTEVNQRINSKKQLPSQN